MSLEKVLTGSTSLSDNTFIILVPSVSSNHSAMALNSPVSVMTILFLESVWGKCMYTLEMASIPCKVMSLSMFASIHLRNISSSILSTSSSAPKVHFSCKIVLIIYNYITFSKLSVITVHNSDT